MRALTTLAIVFALVLASSAGAAVNRTDPDFVGTPAGPVGGGGSCPPGVVVGSLPFSDAGNTCPFTNTITNYGGVCGTNLPFPYPGPETIYQINLGVGNNVSFSASLTGSAGDLVLYLLSTCGSAASCVANSQDAIGPGVGPEDIAADSYPPGQYFIYVDSYYGVGNPASCGIFTLNVAGTLPVELLEFSID